MTIKKTGRNDHNKRQAGMTNKKAVMHMTLPLSFSADNYSVTVRLFVRLSTFVLSVLTFSATSAAFASFSA